jgi:hypothetical protein
MLSSPSSSPKQRSLSQLSQGRVSKDFDARSRADVVRVLRMAITDPSPDVREGILRSASIQAFAFAIFFASLFTYGVIYAIFRVLIAGSL